MKKTEIKRILSNKLREENSCFTTKDIIVKDIKDGFIIMIKDFEACPFKVTFFEGEWWVYDEAFEEYVAIDKDLSYCIIAIGYEIATKF